MDNDKAQTMKNCSILHYSRRNPTDAADVREKLSWRRIVNPFDIELVEDEESGDHEVRREQLTDLVMALSNRPLDAEDVTARLATFEEDADVGCGCLAWRYREVCTRPGYAVEGSVEGELTAMATLVRDEKALLARLSSPYGPFLVNRPHLADRALNAELDKVDTDASWRSPDAALRRRASLSYLRHATVLAFGTDDGFSLLHPVLEERRRRQLWCA